ncbi:lantibiotic dehydratase [Streptomyces sp. NPDC048507]|uniref:lantibiotic dehydratase n=1 Tax=Streptomyces sp. NPDC048507 TaxID=3365560 RepID=UPI0037243ABF
MTPPAPAARTAPYALVRATTLSLPAQSPDAAAFRHGLAELTLLEGASARLLPRLTDALYESRGGHHDSFHRDVVLPLRRALHNGREPRPALLDALGDLPGRVPALREWLELRGRLAAGRAVVAGSAPRALAAEREALYALCREPALALAASATSADLLAAVERAGAGATGRRARKEEPGVLRHAVRAATRSTPVSWFTAVGWVPLPAGPAAAPEDAGRPGWGDGDLLGPTGNTVRTSRSLVAALCEALLADPRRRARLPHRMTSAARTAGGRATFVRTRGISAVGRFVLTDEDEVEVVASAPLERVAQLCRTPATPGELAAALAAPQDRPAALAYVEQLVDAGLLVPVPPVGAQDDDPLGRLAGWLREGADADATHGDAALAARLDEIADATRKFGAADPRERTVLLAGLRERWAALLAAAGRPLPGGRSGVPPVLTEDVVARRPVAADGLLDPADHEALREVGALAELFDLGHLVRRALRDRFVARYGPGGVCRPVWDFGRETVAAWEDTVRDAFRPLDDPGTAPLPTRAAELVGLRSEFEEQVRELARSRADADADVVLPPELVGEFTARLPGWAAARPLSYAHFLQRDAQQDLLVLNHVYGGWGRVGSRFLGLLDARAAGSLAREVGRAAGPAGRPVQFRPVQGFNANLQPRFMPDEVVAEESGPAAGSPPGREPVGDGDLELFHDEATDQVRLRPCGTGGALDVFYPGLLVSGVLTTRGAPLVHDHPEGVVSFASLVPRLVTQVPGGPLVRTPRLRYRHVVLRRRRWKLAAATVAALRAELAADAEVPYGTAARWRALLGVPDQVFLHAPLGAATESGGAREREREREPEPDRSAPPKPQLVDLGNALHLRCLDKWLSRHPDGVVLEEALPAPGGRERPTRAVEAVVETYRAGSAP